MKNICKKAMVFTIIIFFIGASVVPSISGFLDIKGNKDYNASGAVQDIITDATSDVSHWNGTGSDWDWEHYINSKPNIDIKKILYDVNEFNDNESNKIILTIGVSGVVNNSSLIWYHACYINPNATYWFYYSNEKSYGKGILHQGDEYTIGNVNVSNDEISCTFNLLSNDTSMTDLFGYVYEYTELYDVTNEYWVDFAPDSYLTPNTIYIDDDFNVTEPGWEYDHFDKIKYGIKVVVPDGIVNVYNGMYRENIVIDKTIDLIGENRESTIIDGNFNGDVIHIPQENPLLENININGFTIQNGGTHHGVFVDYGYRISISENIIKNNERAIWLYHSGEILINGNSIFNNNHGIYLEFSEYNTITQNHVFNNSYGIVSDTGDENTFAYNEIRNNSNAGIVLIRSLQKYLKNHIEFNNFIDNEEHALFKACKNTWNDNYWSSPLNLNPPIHIIWGQSENQLFPWLYIPIPQFDFRAKKTPNFIS